MHSHPFLVGISSRLGVQVCIAIGQQDWRHDLSCNLSCSGCLTKVPTQPCSAKETHIEAYAGQSRRTTGLLGWMDPTTGGLAFWTAVIVTAYQCRIFSGETSLFRRFDTLTTSSGLILTHRFVEICHTFLYSKSSYPTDILYYGVSELRFDLLQNVSELSRVAFTGICVSDLHILPDTRNKKNFQGNFYRGIFQRKVSSSYLGPPRGPDEVLDHLGRLEPC